MDTLPRPVSHYVPGTPVRPAPPRTQENTFAEMFVMEQLTDRAPRAANLMDEAEFARLAERLGTAPKPDDLSKLTELLDSLAVAGGATELPAALKDPRFYALLYRRLGHESPELRRIVRTALMIPGAGEACYRGTGALGEVPFMHPRALAQLSGTRDGAQLLERAWKNFAPGPSAQVLAGLAGDLSTQQVADLVNSLRYQQLPDQRGATLYVLAQVAARHKDGPTAQRAADTVLKCLSDPLLKILVQGPPGPLTDRLKALGASSQDQEVRDALLRALPPAPLRADTPQLLGNRFSQFLTSVVTGARPLPPDLEKDKELKAKLKELEHYFKAAALSHDLKWQVENRVTINGPEVQKRIAALLKDPKLEPFLKRARVGALRTLTPDAPRLLARQTAYLQSPALRDRLAALGSPTRQMEELMRQVGSAAALSEDPQAFEKLMQQTLGGLCQDPRFGLTLGQAEKAAVVQDLEQRLQDPRLKPEERSGLDEALKLFKGCKSSYDLVQHIRTPAGKVLEGGGFLKKLGPLGNALQAYGAAMAAQEAFAEGDVARGGLKVAESGLAGGAVAAALLGGPVTACVLGLLAVGCWAFDKYIWGDPFVNRLTREGLVTPGAPRVPVGYDPDRPQW